MDEEKGKEKIILILPLSFYFFIIPPASQWLNI
jgi:hypothetical protein